MRLREVVTGSCHPAAEGLKLRWFNPGFPVQTALPISFQAPSLFILSRNMSYMAPLCSFWCRLLLHRAGPCSQGGIHRGSQTANKEQKQLGEALAQCWAPRSGSMNVCHMDRREALKRTEQGSWRERGRTL